MTSQQKLIGVIIGVAVMLFGGLLFALVKMPSDSTLPTGEIVFLDEQASTQGKQDAKVVVRMYSDLQCPACRAAEPALKTIMQAYGDRVKFVWKDFPLVFIHQNARAAANAGRCAEAQGKFWEYHDRLFDTQEAWSRERDPKERFTQFAREAGLNEGDFSACYKEKRFDDRVMANVREGEKNGVNSTPTFFINNRQALVRSEADWRSALETVLKASEKSTTSTASP